MPSMEELTRDELALVLRDLLLSWGLHKSRTHLPGPAELDEVLVATVSARLDVVRPLRERSIDRDVAWRLLVAAVTSAPAATSDDQRLLLAAQHLLAIGPDPRRPRRRAPYDDTAALIATIGLNGASLKRRANLESASVKYAGSIVFRRLYSAVASGLGETVDTLRPDKSAKTIRLGQAVAAAYQTLLRDDTALAHLADDPAAGLPGTSSRLWKPTPWQWVTLAGVTALVIAVGVILANTVSGTSASIAAQAAPLVSVESVASPKIKWNINSVFWVPATAPIEELEAFPRGCSDDRAQEWLRTHGQYRDTYFFTVRNLTEDTIGLGQVAARGTASPAQPGLLIACSGGGEGGQIEWSQLALTLAPDEVATLRDPTRPSEYFWRDLASGEKGGIQIFPNGDQDFTGTLTLDVTPLHRDVQHLTVPDLDTVADRTIEWHAVPSGKQLLYRLPSPDDPTTCSVNDAPLSDCTVANLRTVLNQLWG